MIHVIAKIELKPGVRDQFLAEFHKLIPLVIAEDGCLEYGPTIDISTGLGAQPPINENSVTVVEKWQSLDHLKAHLTAPHMTPYRAAVKELVLSTNLSVLEPA